MTLSPSEDPAPPVFSFGVIADVQYADKDNEEKYGSGKWRYYRTSIDHVAAACRQWQRCEDDVTFVLQLGDLIDGCNADVGRSDAALQTALGAFKSFEGDVHHIWGNNEFYNYTREDLVHTPLVATPAHRTSVHRNATTDVEASHGRRLAHYYDFSPAAGFRVVVLDTYEVSLLGYRETDVTWQIANEILRSQNPNSNLNSNEGMVEHRQRYLQYNGAISSNQLRWLKTTLALAYGTGEQVFVAGHNPIFAASSDHSSLCWNSEAILQVLHQYPQCVRTYFCGHDHNGGYATDSRGIHHVTLPGTIETHPDSSAYGTIHVHKDSVVLKASGRLKSMTLTYDD